MIKGNNYQIFDAIGKIKSSFVVVVKENLDSMIHNKCIIIECHKHVSKREDKSVDVCLCLFIYSDTFSKF